jgi:butyryl-CoA dehydrogenase/short/branched chain acyl-CoA dehydrogenase
MPVKSRSTTRRSGAIIKAMNPPTPDLPGSTLPLTLLSEEEELFRTSIRAFAEEQIRPLVAGMDRDAKMDPMLIRQFFELGLMGIEVSEANGGSGGTFFMCMLAVEELSRVDAAAAVVVDVQNTLVNNAFIRWGAEDQLRRFLPRLSRDTVGAYALSEAGSGSDAFALATRAEERAGGFVLNGRKLWITNAAEAGIFIIFANANPAAGHRGITAFIVESGTPGLSVGKKEDKLGIRASSTCELILEDCFVPRDQVLGEVGKGYRVAMETLNEGRIGIGAQMVGVAQGALESALRYSRERTQFGAPIASFQAVQFQLAEMATELEAARLMVYNAARLKMAGRRFGKEAAMAKHFASRAAEQVTSVSLEIFGGYGYTKEYPVEKFYRDAKIGKIYEGTSNMQLQTIAKLLLSD